jgi:hypothetical protein
VETKNIFLIEADWIKSVFNIGVQIIEQQEKPDITGEELFVEVIGKLNEPEDMEWAAVPLLFTLAALSFSQARPREYSKNEYNEKDDFLIQDFLNLPIKS